MSPFSAGDTGPLAVPGHSGTQGPEHGAWRGEQVWCHQLPILLPAVSERLLLPGPCVSVSPPVSPIRPCVSPFFLPGEAASLSRGLMSSLSCKSPEESLGKQGAPSAGGADVCLRQGRGVYSLKSAPRALHTHLCPPAQQSRPRSLAHSAPSQRQCFCTNPTAALALFPTLLSSQTDSLAGCGPGKHSAMPDPPSLWFSNCRKVH